MIEYSEHTSGSWSPTTTITTPVGSRPRRPARPDICVYSPGRISRKLRPSCLHIPEKTTDRAGMLTPCRQLVSNAIEPVASQNNHGKRLRREKDLDESPGKQYLNKLKVVRHHKPTVPRPPTSFTMGKRPPWCTPIPRDNSSRILPIWGNFLSEPGDDHSVSLQHGCCMTHLSAWTVPFLRQHAPHFSPRRNRGPRWLKFRRSPHIASSKT